MTTIKSHQQHYSTSEANNVAEMMKSIPHPTLSDQFASNVALVFSASHSDVSKGKY